ncbi:unnamed protein product [Soboliphyme baturini]|uniref:HTH_48 domain-containing protein n=1 Tax=Soboliphyme baturini TaxID=241478 RepID=A0A183J7P1_9BILA|nr:unnamed protein product [Soboliphyme baturini]
MTRGGESMPHRGPTTNSKIKQVLIHRDLFKEQEIRPVHASTVCTRLKAVSGRNPLQGHWPSRTEEKTNLAELGSVLKELADEGKRIIVCISGIVVIVRAVVGSVRRGKTAVVALFRRDDHRFGWYG